MKSARVSLAALTIVGAGLVGASPAMADYQAAVAGPDANVSCNRSTGYYSPQFYIDGTTSDAIAPNTEVPVTVAFSDGSSKTYNSYLSSGWLAVQGDLAATAIPVLATYANAEGVTVTAQLVDAFGTCALAVPVTAKQTPTCGTDNDTIDVQPGTEISSDTGWVDGKRTVTLGPPNHYSVSRVARPTRVAPWLTDGTNVGRTATVTFVDAGDCLTRIVQQKVVTPVTETEKVPATVRSTSCTDPAVGTFQVDAYTPRTQAQVNTIRANSARNVLPYRFDGPLAGNLRAAMRTPSVSYASLWGSSKVEFVTIRRSDVVRAGSLRAAIDAKTRTVPSIGGSMAVRRTYTTAWKLAAGATVASPWTARPDTSLAKAQVEWDKVAVPAPVCTTTTTTVMRDVTVSYNKITYVDKEVMVPPTTPQPRILVDGGRNVSSSSS